MCHTGETGEVHAVLWCGHPKETDHLQDLGVDGTVILKYIFKKWDGEAWTGLISLRIRTGGGRL
jgi:hypothetical protein